MPNIVFAWELGGGYGHLGPFRPLAERLIDAGHSVSAIVKDLARTAKVFRGLPISIQQAPIKLGRPVNYNPTPSTFCHLLQNMGYSDHLELATMIQAWRTLFQAAQPDCFVFDHCPTGMLAARGWDAVQYTIGTGFFCPVDEFPLREMAPWRPLKEEVRADHERQLVDRINEILLTNGQPTIDRMGEIYSSMTDNLLTTFKELDHFSDRPDAEYLGAWSNTGESIAEDSQDSLWPEGRGRRIYAYLKPNKSIKPLLAWLSGQGHRVLVVGDGLNGSELSKTVGPNVRILNTHIDLGKVRQNCDLAITNANHGTCCEFLLAGCPLLLIPLTFEQSVLSHRLVELGVAVVASSEQPRQVIQQLSAALSTEQHRHKAEAFAQQYHDFDPNLAIEACFRKLVQGIETISS